MTDQNETPKWVPDSATLIKMAELEWHNREERRGIHERVPWMAGWMSGYLTPMKPDIHTMPVIDAAEAVGEATTRIFDIAYRLGVMHGKTEGARTERDRIIRCIQDKCNDEINQFNGDLDNKDRMGATKAAYNIRDCAESLRGEP